jgi:hypothetical protein
MFSYSSGSTKFLPFWEAMSILHDRLQATEDEVAMWIATDEIVAYLPDRKGKRHLFSYDEYRQAGKFDYLPILSSLDFKESEIKAFTPAIRYLPRAELEQRWSTTKVNFSQADKPNHVRADDNLGERAAQELIYIQQSYGLRSPADKQFYSGLVELHPIVGFVDMAPELGLTGFFDLNEVERIENDRALALAEICRGRGVIPDPLTDVVNDEKTVVKTITPLLELPNKEPKAEPPNTMGDRALFLQRKQELIEHLVQLEKGKTNESNEIEKTKTRKAINLISSLLMDGDERFKSYEENQSQSNQINSEKKIDQQHDAIREAIANKKYPPMAIPTGGKETIRESCETENPDLFGTTSFERAWKIGVKNGLWRMEFHDSFAHRGVN